MLADPAQAKRSLFYFREPLPYEELIASGQMRPETAAEYTEGQRPDGAGGVKLG